MNIEAERDAYRARVEAMEKAIGQFLVKREDDMASKGGYKPKHAVEWLEEAEFHTANAALLIRDLIKERDALREALEVIPPDKLRELAQLVDLVGNWYDIMNCIQDDLRRMADLAETALAATTPPPPEDTP